MARNRTIRPEFWGSEQIGACSPSARLLLIGLSNFADDAGRMPFSIKAIRMRIFGFDDLSTADVENLIGELSSNGLIEVYEVNGRRYLEVIGWARDQKINRPSPSELPDRPKARLMAALP